MEAAMIVRVLAFLASVRLDAAASLPDLVARLNELQPDVLVGYGSMIPGARRRALAGRLRITPRGVNASSEVLTAEACAMATAARLCPRTGGRRTVAIGAMPGVGSSKG
jgi:hypothetical protein